VHGGSVTAAAQELVVTQPSVSAAVTALSREVGVKLVERDGRGIRATPAGLAYAAYAVDVLGLLDDGRRAAHEAAAGGPETLSIAAVTTAAESFVPPLLQAFAAAHPHVSLALEVGNREQVLELVVEHRADVAIAGRPPPGARVEARPIGVNELVLITRPDDPRAGESPVAPVELADDRWLLREPGSGTRLANEEFLAEAGLGGKTMTLGSNGAIKQAARAGLGVSLVSRASVAAELASGLLGTIAVSPEPTTRDWFALRAGSGPVRPLAAAFFDFTGSPGAQALLEAELAGRPVSPAAR
jgi:LysR family transcriptional regulator, low CO2-responsive transcriptional regulator